MGGGRSILLIEDDALTSEAFALLLEEAGLSVVGPLGWLGDATVAIDLTQIDAAVVDVNLHGVKCFSLMDELDRAAIPFVITTGYSSDVLPERFKDRPFLEKPFADAQLLELLNHILADKKTNRAAG
jgi:DNA-binding NtrC family response regulator